MEDFDDRVFSPNASSYLSFDVATEGKSKKRKERKGNTKKD